MAIQISGTTVIDNSRNLTNTVNITASGTIAGDIIATTAVAEAGTDNTKLMTPLRVAEAITALGGDVINRIQRGSTAYSANSVTAPITAVTLAKSFISQGDRQNMSLLSTPSGGNLGLLGAAVGGGGAARLTSTTAVTVTASAGGSAAVPGQFGPTPISISNSGTLDWEVIEFK